MPRRTTIIWLATISAFAAAGILLVNHASGPEEQPVAKVVKDTRNPECVDVAIPDKNEIAQSVGTEAQSVPKLAEDIIRVRTPFVVPNKETVANNLPPLPVARVEDSLDRKTSSLEIRRPFAMVRPQPVVRPSASLIDGTLASRSE